MCFGEIKVTFRLKEERERLGITQKALIEESEVSKQTVIRWESGGSIPSNKLGVMESMGFDIYYIITGKKNITLNLVSSDETKEYINIPILNIHASAGHGAEILTEKSDKSLIFKKEWINAHHLQSKDLVMIYAKGDSMEPSITCGDELLIDKSPMDRFVDGIYIIRIEKDLFVKRLRKRLTGAIDIISDNPAYPNETIDDSNLDLLHVIGKVVWIGRAV